MKKKALRKDFFIEIKRTYTRFLSIFGIVALGVAFYSGMRSAENDMLISADRQFDETSLMDFQILSYGGFSEGDVEKISQIPEIEYAKGTYSTDVICLSKDNQTVVKVLSYTDEINELELQEGRLPKTDKECILDSFYMDFMGYQVGDKITFENGSNDKITITGVFESSRYLSMDKGTSKIGDGSVDGLAVVIEDYFNGKRYTEIYAIGENSKDLLCYSDEYRKYIDEIGEKISDISPEGVEAWLVLDRDTMVTYLEYESDAEKIGNIAVVFPIIFFLVAALVSLTTMTRMVEEQRVLIGTYKAIGYSKISIAMKYIMYAFLATIFASLIGGYIGSKLLPMVIMNTYKMLYPNLNVMLTPINEEYFLSASILAVLCVVVATLGACYKELASSPAVLMRPAAPKEGKRVLLERIPIIWNRLNFIWKSTIRNFLRYKKRLFMTLFGISGCMALLLVGFGLKNSINSIVNIQYDELHTYDGFVSGTDLMGISNTLEKESEIDNSFLTLQTSVNIEKAENSVDSYLFVPENFSEMEKYIKIRDRESGKTITETEDAVYISEKAAKILSAKIGDTIEINTMDGETYQVEIGGIFENYVYHYIYMNKELYGKIFGMEPVYNQIYFSMTGTPSDDGDALSKKLLAMDGVGGVSFIKNIREKFSDMMGSLNIIIIVLVVSAAGLAFIVLYNLNNINISERKRELATLKVLGFYNLELSRYVYRENIIITIIGIIVGCVFGFFLHKYIITTAEVNIVMFGRDIFFSSYLKSIALTLVFSFIVNFTMHFKLKKIDMTTSLKSVE